MPAPWLKPTETLGMREMGSDPRQLGQREASMGSFCQPQTNPRASPRCWLIPRDIWPLCSPLYVPVGSVPPPLGGPGGTQTALGSHAGLPPGAAGLPARVPTCRDRCLSQVPAPSSSRWGEHPPACPSQRPERRHLSLGLTSPPPSPPSSASSLPHHARWAALPPPPPAVPGA